MDARRSFYLAALRNDLGEPTIPPSDLNCHDIPYIIAANDNFRVKDRLSARCRALLRRLIGLDTLVGRRLPNECE
jgi:hypothetical protein